MSLLIKGMDMPKDCGECDLRVTLRFKNNLINFCPKTMKNVDLNELHNECPLKETSPHGRLIDADVLENQVALWQDSCRFADAQVLCTVIDMIHKAPTVIGAEVDE